MPLAFLTDGIALGIVIIAVAAVTAGFGLFLQAYSSRFVPQKHATFFNLCSVTYPHLSVAFDVAIAIQCYGCAISYLVLIGDLMPTVFPRVWGLAEHARTFWILASGALCVPLSFLRNLDSLKYTSVLGLVAIGYLVVLVVGEWGADAVPAASRGHVHWMPGSWTQVCSTFSIIVFAFTGHQNMFSIINEASDKSLASLTALVYKAIASAAALFCIVGLAGYLTFGDLVLGNVIVQYPALWRSTIGRLAIVFMVVFSFPLMIHPARISVNNIYYWLRTRAADSETETAPLLEDGNARPDLELASAQGLVVPFPDQAFYVITTVLLVVGYFAAASIQSFALVLAIVGATGSTAISFILPGLFGYKLAGDAGNHVLSTASLVLVVWGFVVMVVCLYSTAI